MQNEVPESIWIYRIIHFSEKDSMQNEVPESIWIYRIIHFSNMEFILKYGIYTADSVNSDPDYLDIGNSEIIKTRSKFSVKIKDYGFIGEYIPFYFGRQSIMLYNILTGHGGLRKHFPGDIIYICCKLEDVIKHCKRFFFTDGQANKQFTEHFSDVNDLNKVDWNVVYSSDFKKTEEDGDKLRRYQAEFLVHEHVPVTCINKIVVYNKSRKIDMEELLSKHKLNVPVEIAKKDVYYFHF
jgi:hypothetical protein